MVTRELAEWASKISFGELPEEVVHQAKLVVLDFLGASFFTASSLPWGKVISDFAALHGGRQPEATIIGSGRKTLAEQAALANGTLAEGYELSDSHPPTATRPGATTIPAPLALCETRGRSGRTLIEAIVIAYELNMRIGMAINLTQRGAPMLSRGLYLPSLIGTIASAAGAGKSIGLDPQKMTWALGIAGSLVGGYFQGHSEGAWTRRLNGGIAPSRGTIAALLAELSFVGPEQALEGDFGFYRVFANNEFDPDVLIESLGKSYKIMETWFKHYPSHGTNHAPVECLLSIMNENNLSHTDIRKISVRWHQYQPLLGRKDVHEIAAAQASLPYCVAVASVRRQLTADEFTPQMIEDPIVRAMMEKIESLPDRTLFERTGRTSMPGNVTVETNDGRTFNTERLFPKGHMRNPTNMDERREKFELYTRDALVKAEQDAIYEAVMRLDRLEQVSDLMKLCISSIPVRSH